MCAALEANVNAQVKGYTGQENLEAAIAGSQLVVIPAGVPRKPGMTRDDLFNINASIVKALVSYVVYKQGVTFGGLLSDVSIERLNNSVYGGYKGVLTGAAISGVASIYDAILRK